MDNQEAIASGYVFLNTQLPHVAWAAYRGVLISCPSTGGFISSWAVSMLRASILQNADCSIVRRELELEKIRQQRFSDRISRLQGFYCFPDLESAKRASSSPRWNGDHFSLNYLAELSLEEVQDQDRLDSNWITYFDSFASADEWMPRYWEGEPFPGQEPIWETLVQGRAIVLGMDLRKRAYDVVKSRWPGSLALLEVARLSALVGSDIGNIAAFLSEDTAEYNLKYYIYWHYPEIEEFLTNTLPQLKENGHPVNWTDLPSHFEPDLFRLPDMRQFYFRIPKLDQ